MMASTTIIPHQHSTTTTNSNMNQALSRAEEMTFSYPHWEQDKQESERLYVEYTSPKYFEAKVQGMRNKQRLFEGDRSHASIVALDHAEFTYPNCEEDKEECIRRHTGDCSTMDLSPTAFDTFFNSMNKKQSMHSNRDQIECLRELDSLNFTYPHWERDVHAAEKYYITFDTTSVFTKKVTAMRHKQSIDDGDRSHPQLVALESTTFTYNNWQADWEKAYKIHTGDVSFALDLGDFAFDNLFSTMTKKQEEHEKNTLNSISRRNSNSSTSSSATDAAAAASSSSLSYDDCLETLHELQLTYPEHAADKDVAKHYYFQFSVRKPFVDKIKAMKNRQRLYDGDRTHPDIAALDTTNFSYDGWLQDRDEAVRRHIGDCNVLDLGSFAYQTFFAKMKKKQQVHRQRMRMEQQSGTRSEFFELVRQLSSSSSVEEEDDLQDFSSSSSSSDDVSLVAAAPLATESRDCEDARLCVVCLEHEASHAFIPCGHLIVCQGCSKKYELDIQRNKRVKCPLCRVSTMCLARIYR